MSLRWREKIFFAKPKCEPATSHTCGVVEAIFLQATLVFGLLRYARNDKKQDGHEAKASPHDNLFLHLPQVSCHSRSYLFKDHVIARRVEYTAWQSTRHDNLPTDGRVVLKDFLITKSFVKHFCNIFCKICKRRISCPHKQNGITRFC